ALGGPRPGGPVLPGCQMPEGVSEHLVAPVVPAAAGHDGDLLLAGALAASRVWEGERDALGGDVPFEQPLCAEDADAACGARLCHHSRERRLSAVLEFDRG